MREVGTERTNSNNIGSVFLQRQPEAAYMNTFLLRCKAQRCPCRVATSTAILCIGLLA